jgi:hypothetical protein
MEYLDKPRDLPRRRYTRMYGTKVRGDMTHHEAATKAGIHYSGDVNGWDHGGFFYSLADVEHGWVCYVEIGDPYWLDESERHEGDRYIEQGTIYLDDKVTDSEIADECGGDPSEITIHHRIAHHYYQGDKDRDGADLIRFGGRGHWTENQAMNFIARALS